MSTAFTRLSPLALGYLLSACAADAPARLDELGERSDALLADHDRCELGRLGTLAQACTTARGTASYLNATSTASASSPLLREGTFSSVRVAPATSSFIRFVPARTGEYVFYLGVPNVPFSVHPLASLTDERLPVCARYLSQLEAETVAGGACRLRGAYAVELEAGVPYAVELGAFSAGTGHVAMVAMLTRPQALKPAELLACTDAQLTPALTQACALPLLGPGFERATKETPFGGTASAPTVTVDGEVPYGVRLAQVGEAYEGVVEFTAPSAGRYLVSTGTPNVPLTLRSVSSGQAVAPLCGSALSAELKQRVAGTTCDPLRAAVLVTLQAGETVRVELGRIAPPTKWVRLTVTQEPASDGCDAPDATGFCCADASCTQATFLGEHLVTDESNSLFQARGILTQPDGSYVMAATAAVERDLGYGPGDEPQGAVVRLSSTFEVLAPTYIDSPAAYTSYVGWGAEVARDSLGNYLLRSRLGGTEDSDYRANLTKLTPSGAVLWTRSEWLGYNSGRDAAMALDGADNVILAGTNTSESQDDTYFVDKFDPSGALLFRLSSAGRLRDVAVDTAGNIYTVGEVLGASSFEAMLSKFSSSGQLLRTTRVTGRVGLSLALLDDGRLAVVALDASDVPWLVMLDADGNELWRTSFQVEPLMREALVAVAPSGHLVVATGNLQGRASVYEVDAVDGRLLWRYRRAVDSVATGLSYSASGVLSVGIHDAPRARTPTTQVLQFAPL